jgi:hypothetical protein
VNPVCDSPKANARAQRKTAAGANTSPPDTPTKGR